MWANGSSHVSVYGLEASARFYKELFDMEEIPAPDFPVLWLRNRLKKG